MSRTYFLSAVLMVLGLSVQGQAVSTGDWQGNIHYTNVTVPFNLRVSVSSKTGGITVTFINGSEELKIMNTETVGDSISIPMHAFDATIKARFRANTMTGKWIKHYKTDSSVPFTAILGQKRFTVLDTKKAAKVAPKWNVNFVPDYGLPYPGVGLFEQSGNKVTGTVATEVGDFRFLDGIVDGDSLKLSSFDGAHAFLMLGKKQGNKWTGSFIMDNKYAERWEAFADANASLEDPFVEIFSVDESKQRPFFDILSSGSGFNSIDPSQYDDKVLIIQLLGTWCPNSLDETNYLVDWYAQNKAKEIEVLAVFFEMNYSKEYALRRISEYTQENTIPYQTTLGGAANKGQAALAFPFVNKLDAFPTLMILDKSGKVRYMHRYFEGPATGALYKDFDKHFNRIINDLLAE